uniref:Uncharacterized protein n=1 Tax=Arundo donax TaxID=35708 RepID=A0A0A9EDS0_ARUDO
MKWQTFLKAKGEKKELRTIYLNTTGMK